MSSKLSVIKFLNQTHSGRAEIIDKRNLDLTINADGSITKDKTIALSIITADCAPIFFIDIKKEIICAIHAGWKGTKNNIIKNGVKFMLEYEVVKLWFEAYPGCNPNLQSKYIPQVKTQTGLSNIVKIEDRQGKGKS